MIWPGRPQVDDDTDGPTRDAWPQLTELSDVYTCYSSAVAAWAAYSHPSWESP
jgi:hypothetical protein